MKRGIEVGSTKLTPARLSVLRNVGVKGTFPCIRPQALLDPAQGEPESA